MIPLWLAVALCVLVSAAPWLIYYYLKRRSCIQSAREWGLEALTPLFPGKDRESLREEVRDNWHFLPEVQAGQPLSRFTGTHEHLKVYLLDLKVNMGNEISQAELWKRDDAGYTGRLTTRIRVSGIRMEQLPDAGLRILDQKKHRSFLRSWPLWLGASLTVAAVVFLLMMSSREIHFMDAVGSLLFGFFFVLGIVALVRFSRWIGTHFDSTKTTGGITIPDSDPVSLEDPEMKDRFEIFEKQKGNHETLLSSSMRTFLVKNTTGGAVHIENSWFLFLEPGSWSPKEIQKHMKRLRNAYRVISHSS